MTYIYIQNSLEVGMKDIILIHRLIILDKCTLDGFHYSYLDKQVINFNWYAILRLVEILHNLYIFLA